MHELRHRATSRKVGGFRFPMVSEFFIYIILPVALWPWGLTQPLTEISTSNISWWVKAADV